MGKSTKSKEAPEKKDTLVYIKDPEYAWIPATLEKTEGEKAHVTVPQYKDEQSIQSDGGRNAKGKVDDVVELKNYHHKVLPLQNVDGNGNLVEYADMVQLPYLHEVSASEQASLLKLSKWKLTRFFLLISGRNHV